MKNLNEYVTNGASICCSEGVTCEKFKVDNNPNTIINGEVFATIEDKEIPDFTLCQKKKGYFRFCTPKIERWEVFDPLGVNGQPTLIAASTAKCTAEGGIIKFSNSGQSGSNKITR